MTFDRAIPGLRNTDITFEDGDGTYRFTGSLTGTNPYNMSMTFSGSGDLIISVDKSGYTISPSSRTVYVYAAPTPTYDLNGSWDRGDIIVTFNGSTGTITQIYDPNAYWQSAINKGYVRTGDTKFRNLIKTGDRTWSGQELLIDYDSYNVATGTSWGNTNITLSASGQTFQVYTPTSVDSSSSYTRR